MGFDIKDYIPEQLFRQTLQWIEANPTTFVYYVILILTPFLAISAFLSWKLSKEMQKEAKEKKQKESRTKAILAAKDRAAPVKPAGVEEHTEKDQTKHKKKKKR
ncbi:hypothetical protein BV898_04310 [Hypsibius exemplaris]|uniref:Small integral membrane protein 15 n=1 Tax=Hypsibius exemplaris TaxID=2072580 RepID=A0A1W0X362_HYPEX|nr:hypothetical protein BV898_04310 [Hypsibius exemplaris]